jgi:hypothetical protein
MRRAVLFATVALASGALLLPGASSAQQEPSPLSQAGPREACNHSALSAEWKRAQDIAP